MSVGQFPCQACGTVYDNELILILHRTYVHGEPAVPVEAGLATPTPPTEPVAVPSTIPATETTTTNKFHCVSCVLNFEPRMELETHLETSMAHKLWCEECGAGCDNQFDMDQHTQFFHDVDLDAEEQQDPSQEKPDSSQADEQPYLQRNPSVRDQVPSEPIVPIAPAVQQPRIEPLPRAAPQIDQATARPLAQQLEANQSLQANSVANQPASVQPAARNLSSQPAHTPPPLGLFHCARCNKDFRDKGGLTSHLASANHNFRCRNCDADFTDRGTLMQHVSTHWTSSLRASSSKLHRCAPCNLEFTNNASLRGHLASSLHTQLLFCDICPSRYITRLALDNHRATAHPGAPSWTLNPVVDERVPRFHCNHCRRSFWNQRSLDQHLLSNYHLAKSRK